MPNSLDGIRSALADRYEVERELGRGGMATVYLARDPKHDRDVAIKVLLPEIAATIGSDRFLREIETVAKLTHPHILPLHDSGEAGGFLYYVMPYVEGESLLARLGREGRLPLDEAVRIVREVAGALAYAHERGVVHRDVKPGNILLMEGHATLADFGIARVIDEARTQSMTATGLAVGSPKYMSPEQATAARVDGRSDMYALACVLYELLSGASPFEAPTPQATLAGHLTREPPSLRKTRPNIPTVVEEAIRRAMAKSPDDRFDNVADFREALAGTVAAGVRPGAWRAALVGGLAVALGVGGIYIWRSAGAEPLDLDPNRVMVFPLVSAAGGGLSAGLGEDVATMIGHALDRAGSLRTIDGWKLLNETERENVRSVTEARVIELARSRGASFAIEGRVLRTGPGQVTVALELRDVADRSIVLQSDASRPDDEAWRAGLAAVNRLLPAIIEGAPEIEGAFDDRDPGAIASFLQGEAAFRRARAAAALAHYRDAVEGDSAFGLAAIRGAQAASWEHDVNAAGALIDRALSLPLSERDAALARGMKAFLDGDADRAVSELERALALDPERAVAWGQLGEVYTHLIVRRERPDSIAEAAFLNALALDSSAASFTYHVLESRYRRGEVDAAEPLLRRFLDAAPDEHLAGELRLMSDCVRDGVGAVDWKQRVEEDADVTNSAAYGLAVGGARQLACAEAGFRATLAFDTTSDRQGGRRWDAVRGVLATLLARGRGAETAAFLDSVMASGYPFVDRFYGMASMLGAVPPERADEVIRSRFEREADPDHIDAWWTGSWAAFRGDAETLRDMIRLAAASLERLERRADTTSRSEDARVVRNDARDASLAERALTAHGTMARGDSAAALDLFRGLTPNAPPGLPGSVSWHFLKSLALEQLHLARLLLAAGEYGDALRVAGAFDSPASLGFVPYTAVSLDVRIRAAEAAGRPDLSGRLRARLAALLDERVQPAVAVRLEP